MSHSENTILMLNASMEMITAIVNEQGVSGMGPAMQFVTIHIHTVIAFREDLIDLLRKS